jgi:SAM-dependent methyltransferase
MYAEIARYYDKIYSFKDYAGEAKRLTSIIHSHVRSEGKRLLDVACGTGRHLEYLKGHFEVEGLDASEEMLELARQTNPGVPLHQADMADFDLSRLFDAVTCLFSSIGYMKTMERLTRALTCMAQHLVPGGVLVIEPWFTAETWHPGSVHGLFIDDPELKIARVNTSFVDGLISYFDLHYLIGTPQGTEHYVEHHELGLFETGEVQGILSELGLEVTYDEEGLTGRGLFVARLPVGCRLSPVSA